MSKKENIINVIIGLIILLIVGYLIFTAKQLV